MATTNTTTIKFNQHHVTNGTVKVGVRYSHCTLINGRTAVTLYAKGYDGNLSTIFQNVQNDTDSMTDYFEKDRVRIYEEDALYPAAKARAEANEAKVRARYVARMTRLGKAI